MRYRQNTEGDIVFGPPVIWRDSCRMLIIVGGRSDDRRPPSLPFPLQKHRILYFIIIWVNFHPIPPTPQSLPTSPLCPAIPVSTFLSTCESIVESLMPLPITGIECITNIQTFFFIDIHQVITKY